MGMQRWYLLSLVAFLMLDNSGCIPISTFDNSGRMSQLLNTSEDFGLDPEWKGNKSTDEPSHIPAERVHGGFD